jgi:hypothetical protein
MIIGVRRSEMTVYLLDYICIWCYILCVSLYQLVVHDMTSINMKNEWMALKTKRGVFADEKKRIELFRWWVWEASRVVVRGLSHSILCCVFFLLLLWWEWWSFSTIRIIVIVVIPLSLIEVSSSSSSTSLSTSKNRRTTPVTAAWSSITTSNCYCSIDDI